MYLISVYSGCDDMADYQEMYRVLFHGVTEAVAILQQAQLQAEEIYLSSHRQELYVLPQGEEEPEEGGGE